MDEGLTGLVWKYPSNKIAWQSELTVKEDQAAAVFTCSRFFSKRVQMHDIFAAGTYKLTPESLPLLSGAHPSLRSKPVINCLVLFCSTKEHSHSCDIQVTEGSGSEYGGGWHREKSAHANCRLRVFNPRLFFMNIVVRRKKTDDKKMTRYLNDCLTNELIHNYRRYFTISQTPLAGEWKKNGIELHALEFDSYTFKETSS